MKIVHVLVEGLTEELFVKNVMSKHSTLSHLQLKPFNFQGSVSYEEFKKVAARFLHDRSKPWVTTMLDYQGISASFPKIKESKQAAKSDRASIVEIAMTTDIAHGKFMPFLMMHEFEAFLFVKPDQPLGSH